MMGMPGWLAMMLLNAAIYWPAAAGPNPQFAWLGYGAGPQAAAPLPQAGNVAGAGAAVNQQQAPAPSGPHQSVVAALVRCALLRLAARSAAKSDEPPCCASRAMPAPPAPTRANMQPNYVPPAPLLPAVPFAPFAAGSHLQHQQLTASFAMMAFVAQQMQQAQQAVQQQAGPMLLVSPAQIAALAAAVARSIPPANPSAQQQLLAPAAAPQPAMMPIAAQVPGLAAFDGHPAAPLHLQAQVTHVVQAHQQEMLQRYAVIEQAARHQQAAAQGTTAVQMGAIATRVAVDNGVVQQAVQHQAAEQAWRLQEEEDAAAERRRNEEPRADDQQEG